MAGDWIKLETATPDKPEVILISSILRLDQDAVTGKLVRLWCWADTNSVDGVGVRVTAAFIDRLTGKRGFAAALRQAGWLEGEDGALSFPGFCRHNGHSAKARAMERRKKQEQRNRDKSPDISPKNVPSGAGQNQDETGDKSGTRDREEKRIQSPPKPPEGAGGGAGSRDGDGPIVRLVMPEVLANNAAFVAAWEGEWLPYLLARNRGRVPTIHTLESHLQTCAKLRPSQAVAALKSAIGKEWAAPDENPKVTLFERPTDEVPDDWKAIWRDEFPPEDFPDAPRYEEGEWKAVRNDHKQMIRDLAKKRRRNVA